VPARFLSSPFLQREGVKKLHFIRLPGENRGSDVVPTKVGNQFKDWLPVSTGNPGFRLEFIPMKIGAGMT
jgi:hypothetical protein